MTESIKIYHKTKLGTLYHGDCKNILPELPKVDLLLTDPPYGIKVEGDRRSGGKSKGKDGRYGKIEWDNQSPDPEVFKLMLNSSENQIIFGGNYFIENLYCSPCWVVWNKRNGNSPFADCELAWTSFKSATRMFNFRWSGMIQEDQVNKEKRFHVTQKPVKLFEQILCKYANQEYTVLDCFGGSGTTALACESLDLKWIMIEKEEKYCSIIKKRLQAPKQMRLFKLFDN